MKQERKKKDDLIKEINPDFLYICAFVTRNIVGIKHKCKMCIRDRFTMWLNLYTTRLTLANLGVEDMGIYGVVGSIVSMFAVFSGGMGNAVQRFLTYEIGRDNGCLLYTSRCV